MQFQHHTLLHLENLASTSSQETSQYLEARASASLNQVIETSVLPFSSTVLVAQDFSNDIVLLATASVLVKKTVMLFSFLVKLYSIRALTCHQIRTLACIIAIGDSIFVTDGHSLKITMQFRTSEYSVHITAVIAPNIIKSLASMSISETGTYIPQKKYLTPSFMLPAFFMICCALGKSSFP